MESLNVSQSSYEAQSNIKLKTNLLDYLGGEDVPEEAKLVLSVLEEGFVLDIKQQDLNNAYMKLGLKNGKALQDAGLWNHSASPELEFYVLDNSDVYFKTSTEDKFFFLSQDEDLEALGLSTGYVDSLNSFVFNAVSDYVKQFDYKLSKVQNKGKVQVTTPAGAQTANHIQVTMDLEDIKDFLSYTLGNLAEYEDLDAFALEYFKLMFADLILEDDPDLVITDEEITAFVTELRTGLLFLKEQLDEVSLAELTADLGFNPELNIEFNYYVTDKAQPVKTELKFDLTIEPVGLPAGIQMDPITFQIESTDVYWNVKGDVQLPVFDQEDVYDLQAILSSPEGLEEVNEDSVIRSLIEASAYPRTASFELNSTDAWINYEWVDLKTAPYLENGVMLVPVAALADALYTEAEWNGATKEVTLAYAGNVVTVQIGSSTAKVNGQAIDMGVAPVINNGEALVPLRFVSEALGGELYWYPGLKMIDVGF